MGEFILGSPFLHLFLLPMKPPLIWRQENYSHLAIYKIIGDNIIYPTIHQHHRKPPPPKKLTISSQLSFQPSSVGYIVSPSPYKNIASPMNIIHLWYSIVIAGHLSSTSEIIYILPLKLPMDGGNIQFVACISMSSFPITVCRCKIAYSDKSKANLKGNPHSLLFINQFIYQWHSISCESYKMYVNPVVDPLIK